ncbi:TPA: hypothetical protein ACKOHX_003922, partial [Clostridioides difficile]
MLNIAKVISDIINNNKTNIIVIVNRLELKALVLQSLLRYIKVIEYFPLIIFLIKHTIFNNAYIKLYTNKSSSINPKIKKIPRKDFTYIVKEILVKNITR